MQIGTYKEIIDLCTISSRLLPTFDFGHINALTQGSLKSPDDYKRIFDYSFEKLGDRTKEAHIHFSKIQYGENEIDLVALDRLKKRVLFAEVKTNAKKYDELRLRMKSETFLNAHNEFKNWEKMFLGLSPKDMLNDF